MADDTPPSSRPPVRMGMRVVARHSAGGSTCPTWPPAGPYQPRGGAVSGLPWVCCLLTVPP